MVQVDQNQYEEMKHIVRTNLCAECGGELAIKTNPELGTLEIGCPRSRDHHGYVEKETWTQAYRRGQGAPLVIKDKIDKKMLPGGYEVGTAMALIKTRFPRADLDDPSAALFLMDCIRLDLDPLLGEIIPVTFKNKDRKVVQPVLTEDGWLSLAARACPERWIGPPITEPVTDKEFKKDLCDDEEAWVWKASGKTRDGTESIAYGWLKRKEWEKAKAAGTPAGELPGNQARVRAIKRWVRETFPEARKKMMELTSEWLARGREKGIDEVQKVIEAEYHIVTEGEGSKGGDAPTFTRNGQPDWAKFWAYQKGKGLDEEKVHAVLGVNSLKEDWIGKGRTLGEADEAIDRALEQEKARPAVKRDPETIKNFGELYQACWEDFNMSRQAVWAELNVSCQEEIVDPPAECYRKIVSVRQR